MLDTFTLFLANAIIMIVMAAAFLAAWMRQRDARHWPIWMIANILMSGAMISCMMIGPGTGVAGAPVAMVLIVASFGMRWRAARQFGGRSTPWLLPVLLPTTAIGAMVLMPAIVPYEAVFCVHNAIAAAQCAASMHEFWRDRADGLTSRRGLVASYGIISFAFALRALQGVTFGYEMDNLMPQDLMLQVQLTMGIVHVTSAGAFALSLAYERGAAELRIAAAELYRAAYADTLTGLANRRAFEEHFRALSQGNARQCVVALFDIDYFKSVNDRYGHAAGDKALKHCAEIIRNTIGETGMVARIGGEEFAALMVGISADAASELMEHVREAIAATPVSHAGETITLTISIGLVHKRNGLGDFDLAMASVDERLYAAKTGGRNRVERAA